MAMTLRLDDEVTEMLRRLSVLENRSMQDISKEAIRSVVESRLRVLLLDQVLDEELPKWSELIRRLGE